MTSNWLSEGRPNAENIEKSRGFAACEHPLHCFAISCELGGAIVAFRSAKAALLSRSERRQYDGKTPAENILAVTARGQRIE